MAAAAEVYVYYRIAAAHQDRVAAQVAAFQRELQRRFAGLQARLLRRHEDGGADERTLMETYASGADTCTADLLAAVDEAARVIAPWLLGARHVEVFEPCA